MSFIFGAPLDAKTPKRSPRVPVNFDVEISGNHNENGKPFNIIGHAIRVSRGGATVITDAPVTFGAKVYITAPFGGTLAAEVNGVWLNEEKRQCIGIKLISGSWFDD